MSPLSRDGEVHSSYMGGPGTRYRSSVQILTMPESKNRTSSPLKVLNFRGLVWTAGTALRVLPIPAFKAFLGWVLHRHHSTPLTLIFRTGIKCVINSY